jgi:GAF domain-containing protein
LAWSAPVIPGVGVSPGHLKIDLDGDVVLGGDRHATVFGRCDWPAARKLAEELAELLTDLVSASSLVRECQAELVATTAHCVRPAGETELARRIDAVIRGGAEGLGCQAASMYLLDEATTSLLLRAAWGLPSTSLANGTRELENATADLEALIGHAVVLEDDSLFELWNVPERHFAAAVCVPVSSPTTLLGTLWLYSETPRDFTDNETNLIEIVAGRLAVEIEREMLLRQHRPRPT